MDEGAEPPWRDEESPEVVHHESVEESTSSRKRFTGSKNPIHGYFSYDSALDKSFCNYCPAKITKKFPTNLEKHLRAMHPEEYKKFESEKEKEIPQKMSRSSSVASSRGQESIEQSFSRMQRKAARIRKGTSEYEKLENAIALAFMANSLPYRLVEDKYIRIMFEKISDGRWKENFPTRAGISGKIQELSNNLKQNVAISLKAAKLYSITTDLWSRPGFSAGFVGVTCHFYDRDNEKLEVALLACKRIQQPHTADNIYQSVQSVLEEWEIDNDKILRIVTDNGANIVKAFKESIIMLLAARLEADDPGRDGTQRIQPVEFLDLNLDVEDEMIDDDFSEYNENEGAADIYFERKKRINCFSHNLMLAVRSVVDLDKDVKNVKDEAFKLIKAICGSTKAVELLRHKTDGLGLIKPVQTRWVYWYYTFERLLRIKKAVCEVCDELKILHDIGPMQWEILEAVTELLQPFAEAVTKLEGEKYVTISEVYPTLYCLLKKLETQRQRRFVGINQLAKKLIVQIKQRF